MPTNTMIPTFGHDDAGATFPAYVARPAGTPRAAIIVIQEIFGVNSGIRQKTDDWAAAGYLAIAPDVFWRQQAGVELTPGPADMPKAVALMQGHDMDAGIRDIEATIRWLRHSEGIAKVGIVGFCLGGRVAYLAATRTDIDASVGFYAGMIDKFLGEAHAIAKPLMLHFGGDDSHIPAAVVNAVHETLDDNPHATIHEYDGAGHGFADTGSARRSEPQASLAEERTAEFFSANLG